MSEDFQHACFPKHIRESNVPIVYEVKLDNGELIKAFVDDSKQYQTEGLCWRNAETKEIIYRHRVDGWREIKN